MACDYSDGDVETGGSLHLAKPASLGEVRSKEEKIVRKGKGCKRKNVFLKENLQRNALGHKKQGHKTF